MKYCMECGCELTEKYLDNEGMIPFCSECNEYRFPVFSTAVSMVVMNKNQNKILLIKQYGKDNFVLVAGYVNKGEDAETAVVREVSEELGLDVVGLTFNKSQYFKPSNTLMLNFSCVVSDECLDNVNDEVDYAEWFSFDDARKNIMDKSLAKEFLENFLDNKKST